jgi:hypothetical protein
MHAPGVPAVFLDLDKQTWWIDYRFVWMPSPFGIAIS